MLRKTNKKINKKITEKIMEKVMISSLIASVLAMATIPVLGYDTSNPASYTVQYIIPSDTSFVVSLCGAETQMSFNPASRDSKLVEPNCQSKILNRPWANITNSGNINENFSTNLASLNPGWVELYVGSTPLMADQISVIDNAISPIGWINVSPGSIVQLYAQANFTNAQSGTTSRTIKINSGS